LAASPDAGGDRALEGPAMRRWMAGAVVGLALGGGGGVARADVSYELKASTTDALVRGTVELEEQVGISVQGARLRGGAEGGRSVGGARYQKPGPRLTLEQPDRGRRYGINLDAGTYVEDTYAALRRRQEEALDAVEAALKVDPAAGPPALAVALERTGEHQTI